MAAKRHARRPSSGDAAKELGRNVGSNDDEEAAAEGSKSGDTAMSAEPKALSPKQAGQTSPPSSDNAEAQGSGEASPARSAPRGGAAMMTKTTTSERIKKPPPASQEEDDAEESGDAASPARNPLPDDDTADAGRNKRVVTPKRGKKRSPPPRQEEERPEKRAAGPGGETVAAASAPRRHKRSKRSAEKDRRKKKKKKQLRKALSKPASPPQLLESELNDSREDTPSLPQDVEHNVREMAEKEPEQSNTTEEKNTEHAGDTSAPHGKDMHSPHGEEEQKDVTNEEHVDDAVNGKTSQGRNAPSTKPCGSETEKKKSWSYDDELKILNALVEHAQSHDGALPDSSHLLGNLTFDKIDANEEKLTDKIRKLKTRYRKWLSQGCPSDVPSHQLFKLSKIIWGLQTPYIHLDEDEQVEPISRDFSELSKEYPHLAKEVKEYAETHSSGHIIMAMFKTIDDEKARALDAKCKRQQIEAFKLELGKANLTNELLSILSSQSRVKF